MWIFDNRQAQRRENVGKNATENAEGEHMILQIVMTMQRAVGCVTNPNARTVYRRRMAAVLASKIINIMHLPKRDVSPHTAKWARKS